MCEAIYDTHEAGLVARSDNESNRCLEEAELIDTLEKHLGQGSDVQCTSLYFLQRTKSVENDTAISWG